MKIKDIASNTNIGLLLVLGVALSVLLNQEKIIEAISLISGIILIIR